jgi:hypothetical protein
MYKAQFKPKSPYEPWQTLGQYSSESQAISAAINKKTRGALIIRVVDKKGSVVYTG